MTFEREKSLREKLEDATSNSEREQLIKRANEVYQERIRLLPTLEIEEEKALQVRHAYERMLSAVFLMKVSIPSDHFTEVRDNTSRALLYLNEPRIANMMIDLYGLETGETQPPEQIAQREQYVKGTIQELIRKGLRQLNHPSRSVMLKPHLIIEEHKSMVYHPTS